MWLKPGKRCPWCRELLHPDYAGDPRCPRCDHPLRDDGGSEVRPVDIRYDEVVVAMAARYRWLMTWGATLASVLFLSGPVVFGINPIVLAPLCIAIQMVVVRLVLVRRPRDLLGSKRRFFTRWIGRLALVWLGSFWYNFTAVPVVGAMIGGIVFAGLTALVYHYTMYSLERERARLPLLLWEKLLLALLILLTAAALVAAAIAAVAAGWLVHWVIDRFSGR